MLWVIVGLILGMVLYHLVAGARSGKYQVHWYQWALGVIAAILLLLTVQNYLAFQEELEPATANLMLLMLGLPAVIAAALIWLIPRVMVRGRSSPGRETQTA